MDSQAHEARSYPGLPDTLRFGARRGSRCPGEASDLRRSQASATGEFEGGNMKKRDLKDANSQRNGQRPF